MKYLLAMLLVPACALAGNAGLPDAAAPAVMPAQIGVAVDGPCEPPGAQILAIRHPGAMAVFRPAHPLKPMPADPGAYEVLLRCTRVPDEGGKSCTELHKRSDRIFFRLEARPAETYLFRCRLKKGRVEFYYMTGDGQSSDPQSNGPPALAYAPTPRRLLEARP